MKFQQSALMLLAAALGANACARYYNCKCHDSNTGLQNDDITQKACADYGGMKYYPEDNHSCEPDKTAEYSYAIDNCDWNNACQKYGLQYYQWCWNKQ